MIDETGRTRVMAHGSGLEFVTRAFGVVGVRRTQAEIVLSWDVRRIEQGASVALRKLLAEATERAQFRLCFYYDGWIEEVYDSNWAALRRLDRMAEFADTAAPKRAVKTVKQVDGNSAQGLRWLLALWRRTEGRLYSLDQGRLSAFSSNFFAIENGRFGFIGGDTMIARLAKPRDVAAMIGQSYDRDPADDAFAKSVVDEYESAQVRREPHYDHVCAPISLYGVDRWLLYERLICPFSLSGGREFLTVLCQPSQHIDVPFPQFQPE